jgi:ribonucleoside-diphosphate reductase alpha chain
VQSGFFEHFPQESTMSTEASDTSTLRPRRERLPETRPAITHKFEIADQDGYIVVGLYDDGRPGEVFLKIGKEGSTLGGLLDCVGILTSVALQYGVPLETLVDKFSFVRFEPSGWTSNPDVQNAHSIVDYVFRWLGARFLGSSKEAEAKEIDDA